MRMQVDFEWMRLLWDFLSSENGKLLGVSIPESACSEFLVEPFLHERINHLVVVGVGSGVTKGLFRIVDIRAAFPPCLVVFDG